MSRWLRPLERAGRALYYRPKGPLGVAVQEAVLAASFGRRARLEWRAAETVIIVHQMGKVGSTSVATTLDRLRGRHYAVLHTHVVNAERRSALRNRPERWAPLRPWAIGGVVEAQLREDPGKPLEIITLFRDPVARNISAFFQSLERYVPSARPPYTTGNVTTEELIAIFRRRFDQLSAIRWFDEEIRDVYGLDLFEQPFDRVRGWTRISVGNRAVTLIRTDRLTDAWPDVSAAILGVAISLVDANEPDEKYYAGSYREFRAVIRFTRAELDLIYESDVCRQVFSESERASLRARWQEG